MRNFVASFPYWLPIILWMGVIFFLSSLPDAMTPGRDILSDKLCHGGEYFILAFLILFALQRTTRAGFFTSMGITIVWVALFGLSDEIHQSYVLTRHCDILDLAADVGGAVALFLILWIMQLSGKRGAEFYRLLMGKEKL